MFFQSLGGVLAAVGSLLGYSLGAALVDAVALRALIAAVVCAAFYTPVSYVTMFRPFRAEQLAAATMAAERRKATKAEAARQDYDARLHRALELADHEPAAMDVVSRALGILDANTPSELLLADASYAHIRHAAGHPADGAPCCPVPSPGACAAVRRGQTAVFTSGEELDACPHLRGREGGDLSAACVPVTILGATVGVLHATAAPGTPPGKDVVAGLESVATQVGARLGMIRALARSDLQASTDPLTGLLNRRSLEDKLRQVINEGRTYAVVMSDLDHFKILNDTHGHDAGDRALRLFASVVTQSLRSTDLACRYGGEEFVLVLPDQHADEARAVAERLREDLMLACMSGTNPPFTASYGVVEAIPGATIAELVTAADGALLEAKRTGRDRVVLATIG